MEIIKHSYFKTKLSRADIQEMARIEVDNLQGMNDPISLHIVLKKTKLFVDEMILRNEEAAISKWDAAAKDQYRNVQYNQGGAIIDYSKDSVYSELAGKLKDRKDLLDMAFRMKEAIYDADGAEVPKLKIKSYRKDSLNVKL